VGPWSRGGGGNSAKSCKRRQFPSPEAGHETGKQRWRWHGKTLPSNAMASNDGQEELQIKSLGRTLEKMPCRGIHPVKDAVLEVMKTVICPVISCDTDKIKVN